MEVSNSSLEALIAFPSTFELIEASVFHRAPGCSMWGHINLNNYPTKSGSCPNGNRGSREELKVGSPDLFSTRAIRRTLPMLLYGGIDQPGGTTMDQVHTRSSGSAAEGDIWEAGSAFLRQISAQHLWFTKILLERAVSMG